MQSKRIAVYGLGRSGLAIAKAAIAQGATPIVYDRALPEQMTKQEVLGEARSLGFELRLGWEGRFDPAEVDLLVTNPSVDMRSPILQEARAAGIDILSEIEFAYRISKAPIVAITGTNGKSTTTVMAYLALRECGIDAVLCGNIFGTGLPEIPLTEAAMNSTANQVLVAEISSFQLEWVSQFRPAVAGITNIAPDHLDRYDSFEQYAATKQRIFAAQTAEDYAVIRAYDPVVALTSAGFQPVSARRRNYGVGGQATSAYPGTIYTFGAQGEHAEVGEDSIRILDKVIKTEDMNVIGTHNYANAAMAGLMAFAALRFLAFVSWPGTTTPVSLRAPELADLPTQFGGKPVNAAPLFQKLNEMRSRAVQLLSGIDPATGDRTQLRKPQSEFLPQPIVEALKAFTGIEHRMEYLGSKNGVRIINNSMCTNPDAVVKSAQSVKGPNHLIMGGKDKDLPFGPVKNYLANGMHKAYLFGEAKDLLNTQLGGGFPTYNTLQEAFLAATEKARPGEVIMLAPGCASTDQFQDFRDRGNVFKSIAKEWLES